MKTTTCPDCGNKLPCRCPPEVGELPQREFDGGDGLAIGRTTFARWLSERGEAHYAFANRFGINKEGVARLAGVARSPRPIRYFKKDFLTLVSGETGIPVETLIDDATRAAANPTPPRRYTRKAEGQGVDA